jgi:hypothetical protein
VADSKVKLLNVCLTKGKQISNFGTFFAVGAPVATGVLNPILLDSEYKKQHKPERERKLLVTQELGKQIINVVTLLSLWGLTMVATSFVMKKYADPKLLASKVGQDGRAALTTLITNFSGLISLAILSPLLTPSLVGLFKKTDKEVKKTGRELDRGVKKTDQELKTLETKTSLDLMSKSNQPSVSQTGNYPQFSGQHLAAKTLRFPNQNFPISSVGVV